MMDLSWRRKFLEYEWCPRNPDGESNKESHQKLFLVHHVFEGHAMCTASEALPPEVKRMHDEERMAQINEIVERQLAIQKKSDNVWNRRDALLDVKKDVDKMQSQEERVRYTRLIDLELIRLGTEIEDKTKYQFDPASNSYRVEGHFRYHVETGELHVEGLLGEVYQIRQNMLDNSIRAAMIIELERMGYTVIPPQRL